jgi:hypothetical protein
MGQRRSSPARNGPSWWILLAVTFALMALVVTASAGSRAVSPRPSATSARSHHTTSTTRPTRTVPRAAAGSGPTTTTLPIASVPVNPVAVGNTTGVITKGPAATTTTTSTTPAAATPTGTTPAQSSNAKTTMGYLQPPAVTSSVYAFTSSGPMNVAVTWSTNTQLTLTVSCPAFTQSAGGSSAMAVSLPAAEGSCRATVSEPAPGSTTVAYSITIG